LREQMIAGRDDALKTFLAHPGFRVMG
jgi:hypothetical protein